MGRTFVSFLSFLFLSAPLLVRAQIPDAVGIRAQGMGGAFTAVADDATASWWNPAGLASGAYLNAIIEYGDNRDHTATDLKHRGYAAAFPALGLSYYRLTVSQIQPGGSTGQPAAGRQDPGTPSVRSLEVSQFGATFGQSISRHFVVASTVKLIRSAADTQGGLDLGAMAVFGLVRAGVTVRNAREVTFGADDAALTLKRQVRAGLAVSSATSTAFGGASIAIDGDMRRVATALGDERRVAVGGEVWTKQRRLGARAGVSGSTIGDARTALTGGLSVALRRGLYVEGQLTGGSDQIRKGWGTALRVTF